MPNTMRRHLIVRNISSLRFGITKYIIPFVEMNRTGGKLWLRSFIKRLRSQIWFKNSYRVLCMPTNIK